jgi:CIC family chloride channel protein
MPTNGMRLLVACGAAGGISATFNAPVAGVFFALEVILGEFAIAYFGTVVVASVTAGVIARAFLGNVLAFQVSEYALRSAWELPLYGILGVVAALVGVAFIRLLYGFEDGFNSWRIPEYFKPAIGGLGMGLLGFFIPQVFGVGYGAIEEALHNDTVLTTLLVLLVAKILATSLTLGSGGSGGVFAPSLFIGAMLGGAFGTLVHEWLPDLAAPPGAYALVGMAAVFSATARAPITAIIILFEMTGDYRIILPLMLTTVIASLVAHRLEPESIYTLKLTRRGIHIERGRDVDVMRSVKVSEVMSHDLTSVDASLPLEELAAQFDISRNRALPVLNEGKLCGVVTLQDVRVAFGDSQAESLTAGDIASRSLVSAYPDESMWAALRKMGPRELSSLPVVDPKDPGRLVGMIRRRDIVRAYNLAMMQKSEITRRVEHARLESEAKVGFLEFEVPPDSKALGQALTQLGIPRGVIIVSVRRGDRVIVPKGDTRIEPGDQITAFLEQQDRETLAAIFGRA